MPESNMRVILARYRIAFVRVSIALAVATAVAIAFFIGGVSGFNRGLVIGASLAHMTDGSLALGALNTKSETSKLELEIMIDEALLSYEISKKIGASWFDLLGTYAVPESAGRMMQKMVEYRRHHPSPSPQPEASKAAFNGSSNRDSGPDMNRGSGADIGK
jgi:hypothetical protein